MTFVQVPRSVWVAGGTGLGVDAPRGWRQKGKRLWGVALVYNNSRYQPKTVRKNRRKVRLHDLGTNLKVSLGVWGHDRCVWGAGCGGVSGGRAGGGVSRGWGTPTLSSSRAPRPPYVILLFI